MVLRISRSEQLKLQAQRVQRNGSSIPFIRTQHSCLFLCCVSVVVALILLNQQSRSTGQIAKLQLHVVAFKQQMR